MLNGNVLPEVLYEIPIIKSRKRTTSLKVLDDGSAKILASYYATNNDIEKFVINNLSWLIKNSKIKEEKYHKSNVKMQDGETVFFLGYKYTLKIMSGEDKRVLWRPSTKLSRAEISSLTSLNTLTENETADVIFDFLSLDNTINLEYRFKLKTYEDAPTGEVVIISPNLDEDYVKKLLISEYEKTVEKVINLLSKFYEKKLKVMVDKYIVKKYKARFGQCEIKKKLVSLNAYLAMKPLACIELVLAHEISHMVVFNHSKHFKNTLSDVISHNKGREYLLKKHSSPNYLI